MEAIERLRFVTGEMRKMRDKRERVERKYLYLGIAFYSLAAGLTVWFAMGVM